MKRTILLAVAALAFSVPAAEAGEGGLYLGLHGGGVLVEDAQNESAPGTFNFEFDPGWMAGAAIGYDLRDWFPDVGTGRLELEASWRENDFDRVEFASGAGGTVAAEGQTTVASLMLNTIGEYRDALPWIPYLGVGAGAARITLDQVTAGGNPMVDDDDTVFAWQVLAGFGLQMTDRLYLDLGYRYFSLLDPEFTDATGVEFESEYDSHTALLGVRIDF